MSDDFIKSRLGYEYNLKDALKSNPTIINAGDDICAVAISKIEELEAKLARGVSFVYCDMSYGTRVPCSFDVLHRRPLDVVAVFQEEFQLENDKSDPPLALALFIGDDVITTVSLEDLGVSYRVCQGDTITVQPSQN